ncbi:MAG: hypothetical protein JWQ11_3493 [Rhizobacter sp.]|nr:hypothetical protein [Rhizobacter sp.]
MKRSLKHRLRRSGYKAAELHTTPMRQEEWIEAFVEAGSVTDPTLSRVTLRAMAEATWLRSSGQPPAHAVQEALTQLKKLRRPNDGRPRSGPRN